MNAYGYLSYYGPIKKAKFPIIKKSVTIGRNVENDIRINNSLIQNPHLKLTLEPKQSKLSSDKCYDFVLQILSESDIVKVNNNVAKGNQRIILQNQDEILILNKKFVLNICSRNEPKVCKKKNRRSSIKSLASFHMTSSKRNSGLLLNKSLYPKADVDVSPLVKFDSDTSTQSVSSTKSSSQFFTVQEDTNSLYRTVEETIEREQSTENFVTIIDNGDTGVEKTLIKSNEATIKENALMVFSDNENDLIDNEKSELNSTFTVEQDETPKKGISEVFQTPKAHNETNKSNLASTKILKSALKTPGLNSIAKSVKFNKFIEESIFDKNSNCFSPCKISKKLFVTSTPTCEIKNEQVIQNTSIKTYSRTSNKIQNNQLSRIPVSSLSSSAGKKKFKLKSTSFGSSLSLKSKTENNFKHKSSSLIEFKKNVSKVSKSTLNHHVEEIKKINKDLQPGKPAPDYESNLNCIKSLVPQETPKADFESNVDDHRKLVQPGTPAPDYESHVNCIKNLLPSQTPKADYETNIEGLRKLVQPGTPAPDYESHVNCIKNLLPSQTPKADYETNIEGLRKLVQPGTPAPDYETHVNCIKNLLPPQTPKADYETNIEGLRKLVQPGTPAPDYETHVNCIKNLLPPQTPKADYETNIEGLRKLVQPGTPAPDYESHVNCIKNLLPSQTPKADYETNIEGLRKLVQPGTPAPDYESHVNCIKNLLPSQTPKADYETNIEGLRKLVQPGTPAPDYESHVNCIKNLLPSQTPKADYSLNVTSIHNLFEYDSEKELKIEHSQSSNFTTPKIESVRKTRRTKKLILTPDLSENLEEKNDTKEKLDFIPSEKSTVRKGRSSRKTKATSSKEAAIESDLENIKNISDSIKNTPEKKVTKKRGRKKIERDEIGELLESGDESKKPKIDDIDVCKLVKQSKVQKNKKPTISKPTTRARRKMDNDALQSLDILNASADDIIDTMAKKPTTQRSTRKRTAANTIKDENSPPPKQTSTRTNRSTRKKRTQDKNAQTSSAANDSSVSNSTMTGDSSECEKNSVSNNTIVNAAGRKVTLNRRFKVKVPDVDFSVKLVQRDEDSTLESNFNYELNTFSNSNNVASTTTNCRVTRSRAKRKHL